MPLHVSFRKQIFTFNTVKEKFKKIKKKKTGKGKARNNFTAGIKQEISC